MPVTKLGISIPEAVEKAGKIYRELAEDDKRLAEEFFGICEKPAKYKAGIKAKRK